MEIRLRPLSIVKENTDTYLVGDPETGTFVSMPAVGGLLLAEMQRGIPAEELRDTARRITGEEVDLEDFIATLRELGFLADSEQVTLAVSAPIQQRRWLDGTSTRILRALFGRIAWTFYVACFVFIIVALVKWPELRPRPTSDPFFLGNIGFSALLLTPISLASAGFHECGHWLAARALGVRARFGIDRRITTLVFETDLSHLWSKSRRQRFGPLLAGMAFDSVLLAAMLVGRLVIQSGYISIPIEVDQALAAGIFIKCAGFLWQCMVFLRTDLYAVLVNTLGCHNLWRVNLLVVRNMFGMLASDEADELKAAAPVDLRTARWFRWVWIAGSFCVLAWFATFVLPIVVRVSLWATEGLSHGPASWTFWRALGCSLLLIGLDALAAFLAVWGFLRRAHELFIRRLRR